MSPTALERRETEPSNVARARGPAWFRLLRVRQWTKNLLVFAPAVAAHQFAEPEVWARTALAALGFGLCASCGYVVNDWLDAESDRKHPVKRFRPIAAGEISRGQAFAIAAALGAFGIGLPALVDPIAAAGLAGYLAASLAYSLRIKKVAVLDVVFLATLYCARILVGAEISDIPLSDWFLTFSTFLFLSFAFLKRYSELLHARKDEAIAFEKRGYLHGDESVVQSLGIACAMIAVTVFTLYLNDESTRRLYSHPSRLWALCPVLVFFFGRIWIDARRGRFWEDPSSGVFTSRVSWAAFAAVVAIMVSAI